MVRFSFFVFRFSSGRCVACGAGRPIAVALLVLAGLAAGCGDDDTTPGDGGDVETTGDVEGGADGDGDGEAEAEGEADAEPEAEAEGGADGDADSDADGDGDGDADADDGGGGWTRTLAVVASDYLAGGLALIDLDTVEAATPTVVTSAATVHADAVLACRGGGVVDVVERMGSDRLARYQVEGGVATAGAALDLPDGSNPQDAQVIAGGASLAVPLYEQAAMDIVAGDLGAVTSLIDLAGYADADGLPESVHVVETAGRLFVSLQLLDRSGSIWTPTGPGVLAVFDAVSFVPIDVDAVTAGTQGVVLVGSNPAGPMRVVGPAILVSSVGSYGTDDGGIEAVDGATAEALGFVITEAVLGGDLADWIVLADDTGFAVVTVGFAEDRLVAFDLDTGAAVGVPLLTSGGYTLSGLVDLGDGRIAVGDRTAGAAGVRVFDAATRAELTTAPIPVGLPPVGACIVD
ncbi:MAG: hypothetical protein HY907_08020 [Deltaproteobacteria bacterium]|nr:hypothetical protein [Deltaproteobacteria bacterium]